MVVWIQWSNGEGGKMTKQIFLKVESIGLTNELDMGHERRRGINQDGLCSFLLEQQGTNLFEMCKMKGLTLGFPNIFSLSA